MGKRINRKCSTNGFRCSTPDTLDAWEADKPNERRFNTTQATTVQSSSRWRLLWVWFKRVEQQTGYIKKSFGRSSNNQHCTAREKTSGYTTDHLWYLYTLWFFRAFNRWHTDWRQRAAHSTWHDELSGSSTWSRWVGMEPTSISFQNRKSNEYWMDSIWSHLQRRTRSGRILSAQHQAMAGAVKIRFTSMVLRIQRITVTKLTWKWMIRWAYWLTAVNRHFDWRMSEREVPTR